MIAVAEIFGPTIQGEGPNIGIKTLFVRVAGCDFKCSWCDSKFAWNKNENTILYTPKDLAERLMNLCKVSFTSNIVLTGGNPCLYDFTEVIEILQDAGISIDVETQGSILPDWLLKVNNLIISPKAPSSKQPEVYDIILNWFRKKIAIEAKVAIKIPIFDDIDFSFAHQYYNMITELAWDTNIDVKLYLSVGNTNTTESGDISKRILLDYEKLINMVMNSNMEKVYILPQIHTLVWGNRQGV